MGIRNYKKNIGKYVACNHGTAIFLIEDCYFSSRDKCAYYLLWCIRKSEYMPIMCLEVEGTPTKKSRFAYISAEEANKITLEWGFNCIDGQYFLTDEQKNRLEKKYGIKVDD